ncbi:MAG: ABC transporter ATP-binding protein [Bacillota bacterium]
MGKALIEFKNIVKEFPGVVANDNINLSIEEGKIHAIVGENGAGKTTLLKILYGLHQPTQGEIYFQGERVKIGSPAQAIKMGIGMVHQHFMLIPSFSVAENIVLGYEPRQKRFFTDFAKAERITEDLVREYGLQVEPTQIVRDVSVGIQQRIEILKVLYHGADILILDEPTAVLTPHETEELFEVVKNLVREKNKTVIFITHKLNEVMSISDKVTVMREGKVVDTMPTAAASKAKLAELMVGREVLLEELDREPQEGPVRLEVKHLKTRNNRGLVACEDISFAVRSGEILGIAGVEGNGQSELIEALTGLREIEAGEVWVQGEQVTNLSPGEIRDNGVAHIPEDRLKNGLNQEASLSENFLMGRQYQQPFSSYGFHLHDKAVKRQAQDLISEFDVRTPSAEVEAGKLSGGNMQKLVVAREFSYDSPILLVAQPTRGLDIGAIEFIHEQIMEKRNQGCAVLLVSAELDEIMRLSDRILTIYEGEITSRFTNDESLSKKEVGLYMTARQGEV